jgi:hypothetical protein
MSKKRFAKLPSFRSVGATAAYRVPIAGRIVHASCHGLACRRTRSAGTRRDRIGDRRRNALTRLEPIDTSPAGDAAGTKTSALAPIGMATSVQTRARRGLIEGTGVPVAANRRQIVSTRCVDLLTTCAMESADDRTRGVASDVVRRT